MLIIVPTPIGNLKDITLRSLETLKEVDGIICEDSRRTSLLLNHYLIKKPLIVLNNFNELKLVPLIVDKLKQGQDLALVSDAGTPLISDPGYKLVRECLSLNIPVDSLPGPSSILPALTLSGLPPDKFLFLGYLPDKEGHRKDLLNKLTKAYDLKITYIIFISPHKLNKTLEEIRQVFGDIEVILAKELTKLHQKVSGGKISWLKQLNSAPKGEYVLLFRL